MDRPSNVASQVTHKRIVGYCFIKNYTIVQIDPFTITPTEDTVKMDQGGLNIFEGAEGETGGQVSFKKTKWCLLEFTWYPSGK